MGGLEHIGSLELHRRSWRIAVAVDLLVIDRVQVVERHVAVEGRAELVGVPAVEGLGGRVGPEKLQ